MEPLPLVAGVVPVGVVVEVLVAGAIVLDVVPTVPPLVTTFGATGVKSVVAKV